MSIKSVKKWLAEIAEIMEAKSGDYILETSLGTGQQPDVHLSRPILIC